MIRIHLPENLIEELFGYIAEMEVLDRELLSEEDRKNTQPWTLDLAAQTIVSTYLRDRVARKMAAIKKD